MRNLFIGSSSEGLIVARQLKTALEEQLADTIECRIWEDAKIFSLNKSALDSLLIAARKFDYGILVATKDDIATVRKVKRYIPRDNVMFEMGMFIGSLGLTRAYLLVEKESKLPTDYNGVTISYFERETDGSLKAAVSKIVTAISSSSKSFNLRPVPSAALALSYFDNFIQPFANQMLDDEADFILKIILPLNISDINTTRKVYKKNHDTEEVTFYPSRNRPINIFKFMDEPDTYWDIPTTLSTLYKLMEIVSPSKEIGLDPDKLDWIAQELRHFEGTINVLVEQCSACRGNIEIVYFT